MHENDKKKFKHKFLIFAIIIIIINAVFLPFTFNSFKSILSQYMPYGGPIIEEYNYTDQEFVNLIYAHEYHYNCKDVQDYYFYYDKDLNDVPAIIDEAIDNNNYFKNRNEVIAYIKNTGLGMYSDSSREKDFLESLKEILGVSILEKKVTINDRIVLVGYYHTKYQTSVFSHFENIILPEVEAFFSKGGNK